MILSGDGISSLVTGTRFIAFPRVPLSSHKEGGLAILNVDYVLESQLSEKGREVRLMRVLLDNDVSRGLGVDENTALVVNNPLGRPLAKVCTCVYVCNDKWRKACGPIPRRRLDFIYLTRLVFFSFPL